MNPRQRRSRRQRRKHERETRMVVLTAPARQILREQRLNEVKWAKYGSRIETARAVGGKTGLALMTEILSKAPR